METYRISYYRNSQFAQTFTDRRQLAHTLSDIRAQHGKIVGVRHL